MCQGAAAQAGEEGHRREEKERSKPAAFPPMQDAEASWRSGWVPLFRAPGNAAGDIVPRHFLQRLHRLGAAHPDGEVGREITSPPFNR